MKARTLIASVVLLAFWAAVILYAASAAASTPCPVTDRAAFRAYAAAVRAGDVTRQDRDLVRQAVIRDYKACEVTR